MNTEICNQTILREISIIKSGILKQIRALEIARMPNIHEYREFSSVEEIRILKILLNPFGEHSSV